MRRAQKEGRWVGNAPKGYSFIRSKIISSIFSDNLIFNGENYRTPKVNEILSLLFSNNGNPEKTKKKKPS